MSNFQTDPRAYADDLVESGQVTALHMVDALLAYMSHDDVRGMLDINEYSPRFNNDKDSDDDTSSAADNSDSFSVSCNSD